jgi:hypothetical protein
MATVRISTDLLAEVHNVVNGMRQRELVNHPEADSMQLNANDEKFVQYLEYVQNAAWKVAPALRQLMPAEWKSYPRNVTLYYSDPSTIGRMHIYLTEVNSHRVEAHGFPPGLGGYPDIYVTDGGIPELTDILNRSDELTKARDAVINKYESITEQVQSFLKSQPSLNKALQKHPELAMYIPEAYIERVNAVVARSASAKEDQEPEIHIDIEAIVAAAVAHRVITARGAA